MLHEELPATEPWGLVFIVSDWIPPEPVVILLT
jgi:hypothetical protein